jgi:prephenate dehydrogenase
MQKIKIGIIGFGQFGAFMAKHLKAHATIVPVHRETNPVVLQDCDVVVFAVPWDGLLDAIKRAKPYVRADALIVDVTSVKQKPLALLAKHFPNHQRLGTHPIFGPQSGKNGLAGLPIVLCRESTPTPLYKKIKRFLKTTYALHILEMTPQEHDHEMAHIQGLTHFIGRALLLLDIKSYPANTQSYARLLELTDLLRYDSMELFKTIQNVNPEAKKVRRNFLDALQQLHRDLN